MRAEEILMTVLNNTVKGESKRGGKRLKILTILRKGNVKVTEQLRDKSK